MSRCDLVVVGGGPCGLTAALAAGRRGMATTVLEAGPQLGGMAGGRTVCGQRVDLGSHRVHPSAAPRVRALLDELLGDDLQVRERDGRLRLRDRWVRFPFRPVDMVRTLPAGFVARAAADALGAPLRRPRDDSYAEVVRAGLGPTALAEFHGPMATKLWGLPPDELSGELARKRLAVRTPGHLARRLARTSRASGRTFLSPRGGYGQIVDQLAAAAVAAGVTIRTDAPVVDLRPGDEVTVRAGRPEQVPGDRVGAGADRHGTVHGMASVTAPRVLWTAPLGPLGRAVSGSPEVTPAPPDVPHRGLVLAFVAVAASRYSPFDAHYVPTPGVAFSRLSEPRNYRDGDDPADLTVLCAELPCTVGDETWRATPDAVGDLVADGLRRCGLPPPPIVHTETVGLPAVYPLLTVDDPGRRRRALDWADRLGGVAVLGRHGRAVADNLHHVMDMALGAVDCLGADGTWDEARWEVARRRFDSFVVED